MLPNGSVSVVDSQLLTAVGGSNTGAITNGIDVAFGHDSFAWGVGTNAGGGTVLQPYRAAPGVGIYNSFGNGFVASQVTTPASISVVLAPEPGTLIALGLGAVGAMLRRRKSRREAN